MDLIAKGTPTGSLHHRRPHRTLRNVQKSNSKAIEPYRKCAKLINEMGIGINAGHDLSLDNIFFFKNNIENLLEVSIGHALIAESLDLGIETVIKKYLSYLK